MTILTRRQRLEASLGLVTVLAMIGSFGVLGWSTAQTWLGPSHDYAGQVPQRLNPMLAVAQAGQVRTVKVYRSCYGERSLSPCAEVLTTQGQSLQVMGPDFRVGVALPSPAVLPGVAVVDALRLKKQADSLDQADHDDLPAAFSYVFANAVRSMQHALKVAPHPGQHSSTGTIVDTTVDSMLQPVAVSTLRPARLSVNGFDAVPANVNGTILWQLRLQQDPSTQIAPLNVWWFTVPLTMAGSALNAMHDHPLDSALVPQP